MDIYRFFMVLAVAAGALAWWWQQRTLSPLAYLAFVCAIVVPGQIVGNLFAAFEHPGVTFEGVLTGQYGANIIGGAIGGAILTVALLYIPSLRTKFGTPLEVLDQAALFVPLSMAVGRIGCFAAGDGCYGPPTSLPWGIAFPHGTVPTTVPVHPTMLYDSFLLFVLFFAMNWHYRSSFHTLSARIPTAQFLLFYGIERFLSEFLRLNPKYAGLSQAQWLCIPASLLGLAILIQKAQARKKLALQSYS